MCINELSLGEDIYFCLNIKRIRYLKSTILHILINKIATWWTLVAIKRMVKVFYKLLSSRVLVVFS